MTDSMLLSTDVGAALSLREMAYEWQDDPLTAKGARSLEFLVGRAMQVASGLQQAWPLLTENETVWETGGYRRRIQAIAFLATVAADMLTRTQEILASTQSKHPSWVAPQLAADVGPCLQTVKQLAAEVSKILTWLDRSRPAVSEEMLRRSVESLDRGEGEDVGDLIARLETGSPLVKE